MQSIFSVTFENGTKNKNNSQFILRISKWFIRSYMTEFISKIYRMQFTIITICQIISYCLCCENYVTESSRYGLWSLKKSRSFTKCNGTDDHSKNKGSTHQRIKVWCSTELEIINKKKTLFLLSDMAFVCHFQPNTIETSKTVSNE